MYEGKEIIGRIERVWFPDLLPEDHDGVLAKIDTGAESGALHCTYIQFHEVKDGDDYIEYQVLDESHQIVKTTDFVRIRAKSSLGNVEKRFRIKSCIVIRDKEYPIKITLTDRTDMQYDVILGYKFLEGKFLVDVSQENQEADED